MVIFSTWIGFEQGLPSWLFWLMVWRATRADTICAARQQPAKRQIWMSFPGVSGAVQVFQTVYPEPTIAVQPKTLRLLLPKRKRLTNMFTCLWSGSVWVET